MLHTKLEGERPKGRPRTGWINQIRKPIDMIGEKMERNTRKQEVGD